MTASKQRDRCHVNEVDRQRGRQRLTDRQTDKDRQTHRDRQTDRETETERQTDRQAGRQAIVRRTKSVSQVKPGFHMSGKSQTIGDFTFFRPSQILPIYQICARSLFQIFPIMNYIFICDRGAGSQQFRGLVMSEIHRRRMPMSRTVQI